MDKEVPDELIPIAIFLAASPKKVKDNHHNGQNDIDYDIKSIGDIDRIVIVWVSSSGRQLKYE